MRWRGGGRRGRVRRAQACRRRACGSCTAEALLLLTVSRSRFFGRSSLVILVAASSLSNALFTGARIVLHVEGGEGGWTVEAGWLRRRASTSVAHSTSRAHPFQAARTSPVPVSLTISTCEEQTGAHVI